jgi:hypothetical protein
MINVAGYVFPESMCTECVKILYSHCRRKDCQGPATLSTLTLFTNRAARSLIKKKKLHGLSPRANYTDRATAASRRSVANLCG